MTASQKNRILLLLAALVAAAVIIAAFVHAGEDDYITDPVQLAGRWNVAEVWENEKLQGYSETTTSIYIDKNGGYHLTTTDLDAREEQMGELQQRDGQLYFAGKDGTSYNLHGKQRQLIVIAQKGVKKQTWICDWIGYCSDAQRTYKESMEIHFTIQKNAMEIANNTQRRLYIETMNRIAAGYPEAEAIAKAKEAYIRARAFVWFAEEHDIIVTDEELEEEMNWLIQALKKYPEENKNFFAALRNAGLTYEEYVRGNAEGCRVDCIESKLYKKYPMEDDAFQKDIVNRFHHTKIYRKLQKEMDAAVEKIRSEIQRRRLQNGTTEEFGGNQACSIIAEV